MVRAQNLYDAARGRGPSMPSPQIATLERQWAEEDERMRTEGNCDPVEWTITHSKTGETLIEKAPTAVQVEVKAEAVWRAMGVEPDYSARAVRLHPPKGKEAESHPR